LPRRIVKIKKIKIRYYKDTPNPLVSTGLANLVGKLETAFSTKIFIRSSKSSIRIIK